MKISGQNPELYRALQKVMDRVPALIGDARPDTLQTVVKRLAAEGMAEAKLVAKANPKELAAIRTALMADVYSTGPGLPVMAGAPARPAALVSGGSYTGLLAAVALAKSGHQVTLVESRPQHTRDIRLSMRQGTLDTLALVDPRLAEAVLAKASLLPAENMMTRTADGGFEKMAGYSEGRHAPDASKAPASGEALMHTPSVAVILARDLENVVEQWVKEQLPDTITFVEGKLSAKKSAADGNVSWGVEKRAKDGSSSVEPLPGGKPAVVIVAEGSSSSTRAALDIKTAETTPTQYWTAGVVKTVDGTVPAGEASLRSMVLEHEAGPPTRGVAISDGREGTWLLTEMPPFYDPDPAWAQEQINAHYFDVGALVTGHTREELVAAGASGPIKRDGSVPTAFGLQGKAAQDAAAVLPDGTVVGFMGDATLTSAFQAGGGMNTAVSEVVSVMTLAADLQTGVRAEEAAQRFEDAIFERADAWSAAGIPYFYVQSTPEQTQRLVKAHLKSIAEWRKEGGESPLKRLEAMLKEASVASEPLGPKLAA